MALQMMATQIKPFDLGRAMLNKARIEGAGIQNEMGRKTLADYEANKAFEARKQSLTVDQMEQEIGLTKKRLQNFDREFEANMATKKAQADAYMAQLKTEKIKQHGEMASFVRNSLLHTKTQLVSDPQAYQQAFGLFNQVEGKFKEAAGLSSSGSTLMEPDKFFKLSPEQRAAYIDSQIIDADTVNKAAVKAAEATAKSENKNYSPSVVGKMIAERQALIDQGVSEDDPRIKAYDNKLTRTEGPNDYAPEMEQYVNNETGDSIEVNVRDPKAVEAARAAGYTSVTPTERGYGQAIGKASAERESQINQDSAKARSTITTLTAMNELLDRFESGKLSKVGMSLQQYANALGLDIDTENLASKEAFNALAEQLALQSRNMGEGMVLAGHMSDRDVQFLRDMNPQLVISKGGNKMIIKLRSAIAKRQNEVARKMREFKKKNNGVFDATAFDGFLEEEFGKESIFGIPEGSKLLGTDTETGLPVYETPDGKTIIPEF